ncbi:MAG: heme-binding protein [Planctomycetaceae bacterium]|nr:heme-binding protein [Planctomycetaceae bacterium]
MAERAGYDSPFTPGPLRRNEVLIRLKPSTEIVPGNGPTSE